MDVTEQRVDDELRELWLNLRDDCQPLPGVQLCVAFAYRLGLLTDEKVELWERRLKTCPGHDDEGGRTWCAYGCELEGVTR